MICFLYYCKSHYVLLGGRDGTFLSSHLPCTFAAVNHQSINEKWQVERQCKAYSDSIHGATLSTRSSSSSTTTPHHLWHQDQEQQQAGDTRTYLHHHADCVRQQGGPFQEDRPLLQWVKVPWVSSLAQFTHLCSVQPREGADSWVTQGPPRVTGAPRGLLWWTWFFSSDIFWCGRVCVPSHGLHEVQNLMWIG